MKHFQFLIIAVLISVTVVSQQNNYAKFVNPFIGTGGVGHTFPGAVLPFGMVQLSPDTRADGSWEGCSGYHYSDSIIYGFSHTHLSGTGVGDYADILVMPTVGEIRLKNTEYASTFSHKNEQATAGFYKVQLDNGVTAELTTTARVGIHRYTFPKTIQANIIVDLLHRDKLLYSNLQIVDSITVTGYRVSQGWANEQYVYFVMKFNKAIKKNGYTVLKEESFYPNQKKQESYDNGFFQFNTTDGNPLIIKVGISQTSTDGAIKNLEEEAPHWDFDKYKTNAETIWNKQLSKIEITTNDKSKDTTFYTALYHCMIHPSLAGDVDGKYRGRDNKIHTATDFIPYTIFSLWDTYRALNPLFTIIEQKRTADFINSFLNQYNESKRLPMWELSANETNCMIGFHAVSVIADAYTKNIAGFNIVKAYNAMLDASNYPYFGIPTFNSKNYLEINDESESVSKTLEYAYDNWCIAQVAKNIHKTNDLLVLNKRAQAYKNLFDKEIGFIRPRKNGNWLNPFNASEVNNYYTEANGWQYTFYIPHDINGYIKLMGSDSSFYNKLNLLFNTQQKLTGRTQADITGLVGQYAHGNEPSHHIAYLYNYVGKQYKTQQIVTKIINEFYTNKPNGLIGNEDCGQMSAWYVLSAMGIYQVCPANPEYAIGTPLFKTVKINLENNKQTIIKKQQEDTLNDKGYTYIKEVLVNKKKTLNSFISYKEIMVGSTIEFKMATQLDSIRGFGIAKKNRAKSLINKNVIIEAPIIKAPLEVIKNKTLISIIKQNVKSKVYYTIDGSEPTKKSAIYKNSFWIDTTLIIKAKAFINNISSSTTKCKLYKKSNNWSITLNSKYNNQYNAGGDDGLIDGRFGSTEWRSGEWQGYQSQDFECIIDLKQITNVQTILSSYLQDTRSWILYPKQVTYLTSIDGKNYIPFGSIENGVAADDYDVQTRMFSSNNQLQKTPTRYVKIIATNYGKLPNWHMGFGGDAFIFIDEIEIK